MKEIAIKVVVLAFLGVLAIIAVVTELLHLKKSIRIDYE